MLTLSIFLTFYLACQLFLSKAILSTTKIQLLDDVLPSENEKYPDVSIIFSACNEEKSVWQTITKLLEIDYPSFEIIAVNDRSTDNTWNILSTISKSETRLTHINIEKLPDWWLWKVHALHTGVKIATWKRIIFTDADVSFGKESIQKIIHYVTKHNLDHATVLPFVQTSSKLLELLVQTFGVLFMQGCYIMSSSMNRNLIIWIWAFNIVKRSTLESTKWFSRLKMEVADDLGLAYMLSMAGGKSMLLHAKQDIQLTR